MKSKFVILMILLSLIVSFTTSCCNVGDKEKDKIKTEEESKKKIAQDLTIDFEDHSACCGNSHSMIISPDDPPTPPPTCICPTYKINPYCPIHGFGKDAKQTE